MDLVKLQNERFSYLIDSQVIPLAPRTVISQFFFASFAVLRLDLFELLHELQIDGGDVVIVAES